MTRKANNPDMFSAFSNWTRGRPELPSANFPGGGYTYMDVDCVWKNYRSNKICMIETKSLGGRLDNYAQASTYELLDRALEIGMPRLGYDYYGAYLLQFTGLGPQDGLIYLTRVGAHPGKRIEITEEELIAVLRDFEFPQ